MGRLLKLYYDEFLARNCICCRICRTRVALVHDFLPIVNVFSGGYFNNVQVSSNSCDFFFCQCFFLSHIFRFNVEVPDDERYHQVRDGRTLADAYCVDCRNLLGWKLSDEPCRYDREGRFSMRWGETTFWTEETVLDYHSGGANEQDHDQNVGANEQDHDQNERANEQNPDQNGDANEQDLGANEKDADQDVGT